MFDPVGRQLEFEVRDPVHHSIPFGAEEREIINHPALQRLRHVRQLGFIYLVYPGATHERFSHSLGVMHVAGRMFTRILQSDPALFDEHFQPKELTYFFRIVRLAGLLHDLGHLPFSHSLEHSLPVLARLPVPAEWYLDPRSTEKARHEDMTVALLHHLSKGKGAPLDRSTAQDIAALVHRGVKPHRPSTFEGKDGISIFPLLRDLITGELDADRMDYLLRDSHFAGVTYGHFDMDRIIQSLAVIQVESGRAFQLALDANAVYTFEDFLLARYHMFLQVYFHKTAPAFDHYLEQAVREGEVRLSDFSDLDAFLDFRDEELLVQIGQGKQKRWSRYLHHRLPAKLLVSARGEGPDMRLLSDVQTLLGRKGIETFTCTSRQYLSKLTRPEGPGKVKPGQDEQQLYLVKHWMGKSVYQPVEKDSSLLQRFNQVINLVHLYCLPESGARARKMLESQFDPLQLRLQF